ncbi:MAG: spermidine/putrescine ABC transporter ATP-binding protein, partial [Lachnospiraceae bacterium]|nr:spermidine/putrescine ABC transporter ATP-binding protein [Lachnospiraceae bacterium]
PDSIHVMIAEDHTNYFTADINDSHRLEYNGHTLDTSVTRIIPGSKRREDGTIIDANGEVIDPRRTRIVISIQPQDIRMTDHVEEGLVEGYISNLIYKGDHYSYVIHTDLEQDFIVDDEYLWNMDDHVGLIMPIEKMSFALKK